MSIWKILKSEKENEYRNYINEHISNVLKAWNSIKENPGFKDLLLDELHLSEHECDNMILILDHDIENHDRSKFSKEEFDAYRKEYYPVTPEEKEENKKNIEKAWKHHYTNNHHHWNWYHENNCEEKMPMKNVIHMVADWLAMSYKFDPIEKWYNENKKNIYLGDKQRQFAEKLIDLVSN